MRQNERRAVNVKSYSLSLRVVGELIRRNAEEFWKVKRDIPGFLAHGNLRSWRVEVVNSWKFCSWEFEEFVLNVGKLVRGNLRSGSA